VLPLDVDTPSPPKNSTPAVKLFISTQCLANQIYFDGSLFQTSEPMCALVQKDRDMGEAVSFRYNIHNNKQNENLEGNACCC
jgi:hypothetical protein